MSDDRARGRVLIVDGDVDYTRTLAADFTRCGWTASVAADPVAAVGLASESPFELVVIDLLLEEGAGLALLPLLLRQHPSCRIVGITDQPSVAVVVRAMRMGAETVMEKPTSADALVFELRVVELFPITSRSSRKLSLAELEATYLLHVLGECDGNISETARRLRLTRRSVQRKLSKAPPDLRRRLDARASRR